MAIVDIKADKLIDGALSLVDKLYTSDADRAEARMKLLELAQKDRQAQLSVNAKEAEHTSLFVSGWRPSVGWICSFALALAFIVFPLIQSIAVYYTAFTGEYVDLSGLPDLDWATLSPILFGMLGLGALRTGEKVSGVARK